MADLEALVRLRRHKVEEKQKVLAEIFRQMEVFEHRKKELFERLEKERKALDENLTIETSAYYGRFEGVIRADVERINVELNKLETRSQIAQEEVRNAFADMKRVEIVQRRRKEKEIRELSQKETRELDEIGLEVFRRKEDF